MATNAALGKGIEFKKGNGASPQIFTTIAEVTEIGDFGFETPLVEVTHFQSTFMEYILGMPDGVEFPVTVNYDPANATHWAFVQDAKARTTRDFKVVFPSDLDGVTFSFSGLIRSFKTSGLTPTGAVHATFIVKISGDITIQDL